MTCTLYRPSIEVLTLPDRPTLGDAREASDRLNRLVWQFPFETGFDWSVWLLNLLTCIQRPAIAGPVPGFAYNGNAAGVGKGLLIDIIGNVTWGHDVGTRTYPIDTGEADKVKLALALGAVPIVHFDNLIEGGFYGGSVMDSALTSTITSGRILGQSRDSGDVPLRPVWVVSGNNIGPMADALRRWFPCNLVTNLDSPHERKDIETKDLRQYVLDHRAEILRDAHIILKAHAVAGRPTDGWAPLGSFEEWDPIVRGAVWYATGNDCVQNQHKSATEMPERINRAALLEGWRELELEGKGKTVPEALRAVEENPDTYATLKTAFMSLSRDGKMPDSIRIGKKIGAMKKTPINRMRFATLGENRNGAQIWTVVDV
jgi:hypothetical protein